MPGLVDLRSRLLLEKAGWANIVSLSGARLAQR